MVKCSESVNFSERSTMSVQMQQIQMRLGLGLKPKSAYATSFTDFEKEFLSARSRQLTISTQQGIKLESNHKRNKTNKTSEDIWRVRTQGMKDLFADAVGAHYGFADRVLLFWMDHFAVRPKNHEQHVHFVSFLQDALRKNMAGTFEGLLRSVITHPMMLIYLDQHNASAPNSKAEENSKNPKPANENLARELLELHTIGSGGPYTQADVKQVSLILAGLRYTYWNGVTFNPWYAEPGPKKVMGRVYNPNSAEPRLNHIHELLKVLANHPRTIDNVCRKLVAHFVSDTVDQQIVNHLKTEWQRSGGNLTVVTKALLRHPRVLNHRLSKAKRPVEFILSSFRALGVSENTVRNMKNWEMNDYVLRPMALMGQDFQAVPGPNGWPEDVQSWINPGAYAARIEWANRIPERILGARNLPVPSNFAQLALGPFASSELKTAVPRGSSRRESTTVLLASRDFNRR